LSEPHTAEAADEHVNLHAMSLDLSAWAKALGGLERGITRAAAAPDDEEMRDAVIQRFEYSYELSWKMLKRHLEEVVPEPAIVDQWSFKELIREAAERGLLAVTLGPLAFLNPILCR
jgi:hypothetical protein